MLSSLANSEQVFRAFEAIEAMFRALVGIDGSHQYVTSGTEETHVRECWIEAERCFKELKVCYFLLLYRST